MNHLELIKKKRDGKSLQPEEIKFLIDSYTKNEIVDYQFSAFLMAGFINGFSKKETAALTESMLYSGKVIDLKKIPGVKIDKHSTGGVGDKTSLILAPVAAAAGVKVPMISGRGLGHTGGTLDKLESIPGFRTDLNIKEYKNVLSKCGAVLIGQTKDVAPADKNIYALRDVTGTVESIPLITASIMSKKLAEGIDGLVLDVKTGSGAFMTKIKNAEELADSLLNTAKHFKKKALALITDMNQPLGNYIGNWLEVVEVINVLQGEEVEDLSEVSLKLSGAMIYLGGKVDSIEEGFEISKKIISNGQAYDKFLEMVRLQSGDISFLKNLNKYKKPKYSEKIYPDRNGYVKAIDTYSLGMASSRLGAGRIKKEDKIDPKAGIIFYPKIGDEINSKNLIAEIFTDKKNVLDEVKQSVINSIKLSDTVTKRKKLIKKVIS